MKVALPVAMAISICALAARAQDYMSDGDLWRLNVRNQCQAKPAESPPSPPPLLETAPPAPEPGKPAPVARVQSYDVPDDDDDEDDVPWGLYAAMAGFALFAAVVYLVISRGARSGRG